MMLEEMKLVKKKLRSEVLRARDELSERERTAKSTVICGKLLRMLEQRLTSQVGKHKDKSMDVLAFLPYGSEVDVLPVITWCWQHDIRISVPRTVPADRRLVFHRIRSLEETAPAAPYGIREPRPDLPEVTDPSQIAMIIVPGAAFDTDRNRLGYGGGYYDRYLKKLADTTDSLPVLVAACYEQQIVDRIPVEAHDRKLDLIITEDREIE